MLIEHSLDIKAAIERLGDLLEFDVEDDNFDWFRFLLESSTNPNMKQGYNGHFILANVVAFASIEICELLVAWGAKVKGSSALTIASQRGRAELVKLLLKRGAAVNEIGVASIEDDPEDLEGAALHLIEKERKDVLQILLNHRVDVNKTDYMGEKGKTVLSRMDMNGDNILTRGN